MKASFILAIGLLMSMSIFAQTHIASSNHSSATVNSNQRKIVRDFNENAYIVYTDIISDTVRIFGLIYNNNDNSWTIATQIIPGQSPSLAIDFNDRIHMVFESNDNPNHKIMYLYSDDFVSWSAPVEISNSASNCWYPVSDVDYDGTLNVLWIEHSNNMDHLIYCGITNDSISETKQVLSKGSIYEISLANHLQYILDDLFFGISCYSDSYYADSIQFFWSTDHLDSFVSIYETEGIGYPCISFNSDFGPYSDESRVRLLYVNNSLGITQVELYHPDYSYANENELPYEPIQFLTIDNLIPPIGYSFLFLQNDELKHGFSYGSQSNWTTIMSTYQSSYNIILNPSIAYKHFNPLYVDFIWMEDIGNEYKIYHKREDKHIFIPGIEDTEYGKGFSITGSPNPFTDQINIEVLVEEEGSVPFIKIYNTASQLVNTLLPAHRDDHTFYFIWKGTTKQDVKAKEGIYIVLCTVGDKRIARKISYKP